MSNEESTDSEEVETTEKELFRQQTDEWLRIFLDDCFSNLIEQEPIEEDASQTEEEESKKQFGQ